MKIPVKRVKEVVRGVYLLAGLGWLGWVFWAHPNLWILVKGGMIAMALIGGVVGVVALAIWAFIEEEGEKGSD